MRFAVFKALEDFTSWSVEGHIILGDAKWILKRWSRELTIMIVHFRQWDRPLSTIFFSWNLFRIFPLSKNKKTKFYLGLIDLHGINIEKCLLAIEKWNQGQYMLGYIRHICEVQYQDFLTEVRYWSNLLNMFWVLANISRNSVFNSFAVKISGKSAESADSAKLLTVSKVLDCDETNTNYFCL